MKLHKYECWLDDPREEKPEPPPAQVVEAESPRRAAQYFAVSEDTGEDSAFVWVRGALGEVHEYECTYARSVTCEVRHVS